ncbi:HEAT repeat domain-containing protein [Marininema halotolerans]|uniref:HEAT repeat-containing protein n=1 Tax=Marininema halotolerans TaxID=1155944 RepID=A0A1I6UML8_9BACL|nr:HEAT repeat domain-containing protein [Marininema halotolerans]SFT02716.1 hypothetical protein SAMN05444972_11834 [Marininema halotolerans]
MNIAHQLNKEVDGFWNWSGVNMLSVESVSYEVDATLYPDWEKIIELTDRLISSTTHAFLENEITLILTVLGLDNEVEDILSLLEQKISYDNFRLLIGEGVKFPLYHTRWQIAELLGRKDDHSFTEHLIILLNDKNKYVERRALNSMARLNSTIASKEAYKRLTDKDEMIRYVSFSILKEDPSVNKDHLYYKMKNETSELILNEMN